MKTESQNTAILRHLKSGKGISPMLALKLFGCFRLGARIYDLKKRGFDIKSEMVSHAGKRFALYRMG